MNISSSHHSTLLYDATDLQRWRESLSSHDHRPLIGFVPTMGDLHEGHLSLVREAKRHAQYVVVSLFVNPTQFNNASDFEAYHRDESRDAQVAVNAGADAIFLPSPGVIYPSGAQTWVNVGALGDHLCGATRPGHFRGVCTVVNALFNLVRCQVAVFGEKDYQQLSIIRQMTRDLHLPVKIIGVPTARESGGLAMSSRNTRLTPAGRREAMSIYKSLTNAQRLWREGEREHSSLVEEVKRELSPLLKIDYLTLCDPHSLQPLADEQQTHTALLAIACFVEEVRLIDNLMLGSS